MKKILVIGGGAAGMMSAIAAARNGNQVILFEKNEKLGKKIYITGKGRCNLTNACDTEELFQKVVSHPKFLYSSFYQFTNQDTIRFFEQIGCAIKIERGNRVFPVSDKSSDVIQTLQKECLKNHVKIHLNMKVTDLIIENNICKGIKTAEDNYWADAVIIATGGLSYPSTGSTGDGYIFAKQAGHTVKKPLPALVPLEVRESDAAKMQGLALKNVEVSFWVEKKKLTCVYKEFGEMLFTHFGVSGPAVLSGSSYIASYLKDNLRVEMVIDCKPALTLEQLDNRILRDFEQNRNSMFKNSLTHLLPRLMVPVVIQRSGISPDKKVNLITKEERKQLASVIKKMVYHISGLRGFSEAIITQGGVSVKEVNPSTMESKNCSNLYFTGEVLDLDALTGGYNLQIAWSTGFLAGISAGEV